MTGFDPAELARLAEAAHAEGWNRVTELGNYVRVHRAAIVSATEDAEYWMGQFIKVMRALDLESDPWHSDDVIDMAADFVPRDAIVAAVTAQPREIRDVDWCAVLPDYDADEIGADIVGTFEGVHVEMPYRVLTATEARQVAHCLLHAADNQDDREATA